MALYRKSRKWTSLLTRCDLTVFNNDSGLNNDSGDDVKEIVDRKEMVCVDITDDAMQDRDVPPSY